MKRIISILLICTLFIALAIPVSAESYPSVQPRYTYVSSVRATLSINRTTGIATCTGGVIAKSVYPVEVVVYLQKDMGTYWETITSWSGTDTISIEITNRYAVASGNTYRVYTAGYVYDSNNNLLESATAIHEVNFP